MAIKRREKPLTHAEAIELAKKEVFPFWFGSEPLMAGVRDAQGARVYPLDSRLVEKPWLLFFVGPMALSTREVISYAQEWADRYEAQKLGVMVVLRLPYAFCRDTEWVRRLAAREYSSLVTVMDVGNVLADAFHADLSPKVILLSQNQHVVDKSGIDWFSGTELELQRFFRKTDPGLPLFPVLEHPGSMIRDLPSIEFSTELGEGGDVRLSGEWSHQGDAIVTFDPNARLTLNSPGSRLGIVAQKKAPPSVVAGAPAEVEAIVELARDFPRDGAHDDDLTVDLHTLSNPLVDPVLRRRATLSIGEPRLYHLFKKLPATHREVILRFPSADKLGVAIHGLRFAD